MVREHSFILTVQSMWDNGRMGKKRGKATLTHLNGEKYEGRWKDGQYHGQGTLTLPDGGELVGEFRVHEPWNVTEYDKDGSIIGKFVNGVNQ